MPASAADLLDRICRPRWFLPLLLALAASTSAWYVDSRLPTADEGGLLTAAAKILRGGVFYRDLDAYPFPGSYYLLAFAMRLFGEHLSVARWLAALLYCSWVASLYCASLTLLDRRRAALFGLSLLAFKFLAWPAFSTYLHSDVAFAAACAAIALQMHRSAGGSRWLTLLAGICVGLALTAKQSVGIYLGAASVAALLFPGRRVQPPQPAAAERWREAGIFLLGSGSTLVPIVIYFAAHGLLDDMIASGLIRPFTGYAPTSAISFGKPLAWWKLGAFTGNAAAPYFVFDYFYLLQRGQLPGADGYRAYWLAGEIFSRLLYTSVPVAFGWALVRRLRSGGGETGSDRKAATSRFAWLTLAVVLTAFPRADAIHILCIYPLVWLLLFALAARKADPRPDASRGDPWLRAEAAAVAALLLVSASLALRQRSYLTERIALEKAEVDVDPDSAWIVPVVDFVTNQLEETDRLFVYGQEAQFYFLTGRFYPWSSFQLYPGQIGPRGGVEIVTMLQRSPPKLVIRGVLGWPGVPQLADYAPALDRYIAARFEPDARFFVEHPSPTGIAPPDWVLSVMRPRTAPP
jgi:hypothetical protein